MNTYVLLLRGINVGGKNSLPMQDLKQLLEDIGCKQVRTYIQSGNVVLQSGRKDSRKDSRSLASKVTAEIEQQHGFAPHILVLTADAFQAVVNSVPFSTSEPKSLHVGFLDSSLETVPARPDIDKLKHLQAKSEVFALEGSTFYLHAPDGIGRSKLAAAAEKAIGVPMTMRNWNTVTKLVELLEN